MFEMTHNPRLTAPELSTLWTQYLNDSMSICFLSHSLKHVKDQEIESVLQFALDLSKSHVEQIKVFLNQESYPVPIGFTEEDVNLDAPPLFTDSLLMEYLYVMTLHGMNSYALAVGSSVRVDQRKYYRQCSSEAMELYDRILDVMLKKGLHNRPPYINAPYDRDFITKQSYLTGWFGKRRPLNGIEIGCIYYNTQKTVVKVILEIAFSQVARSKELRKYFERGGDICKKHIEVFNSIFAEENLDTPKNWTSEVSNSTEAPFSDKLMLFHVVSLAAVTVGYYGTAFSVCQRRDLMLQFTRLMAEIGKYAEDGANLLISNGWMEQPPITDDRKALAKKK
ncbi:DUF3231 family protein [Bacillus sp. AK128]